MKKTTNLKEGFRPFVPVNSLDYVVEAMGSYPCQYEISNHRHTKNGDFRADLKTGQTKISVNGTLNEYAFVITLLHEIAHLIVWNKHKQKTKPHGIEWKDAFRKLMLPLFGSQVFPEKIEHRLATHMRNPKASTGADAILVKYLQEYDKIKPELLVDELRDGELFLYRNRQFERLHKLRKRIKCRDLISGRTYVFSPVAAVERFEKTSQNCANT